jgi:hypothetical protein
MVREGDTFGSGGGFVPEPKVAAESTCEAGSTDARHVEGGLTVTS